MSAPTAPTPAYERLESSRDPLVQKLVGPVGATEARRWSKVPERVHRDRSSSPISLVLRPKDDFDDAILLIAEPFVHPRGVLKTGGVGNHKAGINFTGFNLIQQRLRVGLNVSLPHLEGKALIHRRTDRDIVAHADVHARNGNRPSFAAAHDRLTENMHAVRCEERRRFHFVQDRIRGAVA
jgi:hypothetical protein